MRFSILIISLVFGFSSASWASGCGSYDSWLTITRTQHTGGFSLAEQEFEFLSQGDFFVRIRTLKEPRVTLSLPLERRGEHKWEPRPVRLETDDVEFEEGHGCGPVYDCVTGRYQIELPAVEGQPDKRSRIFAWPVLRPYQDFWQQGWVAGDLLPPSQMTAPTSSNLPQCAYGNW